MASKELGGRNELRNRKEAEQKLEVIDRTRLEDIVTNSLGTAILSDVSYGRIFGDHGEKFKPFKFDSPNTVKVQTPDGIQEWLEDGHHRSKGFLDNYDTIMTAHPEFEFTIRDSTNDFLEDIGADKDKPEALTIVQYFNVVAESTKSQADVSEKRSAAYIIRAWETICGKDLAEKFSALHGFNLLASDERQKKFKGDLKEFLQTQPEIIEGETKEERARAEAALHTMQDFIKKIDLSAEEVSEEAFMLIGTRADVIGGEKAAKEQIKGLLSVPAVKKKIKEGNPDADPEIQAAELQSKLVYAMTEPAPTKVVKEIKAIQTALVDPQVSLSDIYDLLDSKKSAANAYEDLQKKQHKANLVAKFQEQFPAIEVTGIVSTMLGRDSANESYFTYINDAGKVMNEARVAVAAGAKSADLDKAIWNLQRASIYNLSNATSNLRQELERLTAPPEEQTIDSKKTEARPTIKKYYFTPTTEGQTPILGEATEASNIKLEQRVTTLEEEKKALKDQVTGLKSEKKSAEDKNIKLQQRVSTLEEEKKALKDQVTGLKSEKKSAEDKNIKLQQRVSTLEEEKDKDKQVKMELSGHLRDLNKENKDLKDKNAALSTDLTKREDEKKALVEHLQTVEQRIKAMIEARRQEQAKVVIYRKAGVKENEHLTPEAVASAIDTAAQTVFPTLTDNWETLLHYVKAKPEGKMITKGKDAIAQSIAKNMNDLTLQLNLKPDQPTFAYLSAKHYEHSIAASSKTAPVREQKPLQVLREKMGRSIQDYASKHGISQDLSDILQFCLYTHKDNPTRLHIIQMIVNPQPENIKEAHNLYTKYMKDVVNGMEGLFNAQVLGGKISYKK